MRGLTKGEQSSLTNPVLQLICRSGGFLADFVSGSFKIDDIHVSTTPTAAVVASTPLTSAHKIGTGRYAIPTGVTTTWNVGTHRVTCSYVMTAGGPTYTQIIDFEVLDSGDFAVGASYVGYLSTRRAWQDGYVPTTVTASTLHRWISEVSKRIEMWTGRWFEPRYIRVKKEGQQNPRMLIASPIIAIEDLYAVWQTTSGQDTYKYEQYLYKVYNRHLDGFLEEDDRTGARLELTDVDGSTVAISDFAWPYGNQNIEIRGVLGWTDPEYDPNNGSVLIGVTPLDIGRAVGSMVYRINEDPSMTSLMSWSPGSVKSMRTRDQSVSFGGSSGGFGSSEPSGDPLVDAILVKYCQSPAMVGI